MILLRQHLCKTGIHLCKIGVLLVFFSVPGLFLHAEVSTLPLWEELSAEEQNFFQETESPEDITLYITEQGAELPVFFTAALLNMLSDDGADPGEGLFRRFIQDLNDPELAFKISARRVDLYLLQNRSEDARELAETLAALFPAYSSGTDLLEIYLSLGLIGHARSAFNTHLRRNSRQTPEEYVKSLFLLARLFVAEENTEAARSLLAGYLEDDSNRGAQTLYHIQSARLFSELLQGETASASEAELLRKLAPILNSPQATVLFPANSGLVYPDIRILEGLKADSLVLTPESSPSSAPPPAPAGLPAQSAGLIQLGNFTAEANARNYVKFIDSLSQDAFIHFSDGNYKVLIDPGSSRYRGTENERNPQRLLLVLKESGIEGFIVSDPR